MNTLKVVILTITFIMNFQFLKASSLENDLNQIFLEIYPDSLAPGSAVIITKGDDILFEKYYGISDMKLGTKIGRNTNFCLASISKQFSAVAILQLVQKGKLSLDDNLHKIFPEFKSDIYDKIKIRHILSHTSGLPDSRDRTNHDFVYYSTDVESCKYFINLDSLNFVPGSKYEYINPTYQLIYQIVERITNMPFEKYMKEEIFDVAGMKNTMYFEPYRDIPHMSHGYIWNDSTKIYDECDYGETRFFASKADGALYSSISDFLNWEKALKGDKLINENMKKQAWSAHIKIDKDAEYGYNKNTGYGYGWFIQHNPGEHILRYHLGDNGGFFNYAGYIADKDITVLFFANIEKLDRVETANKIFRVLKKYKYL